MIGLARGARLSDFTMDAVGVVQRQVLARIRGYWEHTAPANLAFPHTYAHAREIAANVLPGMRWRRLPLFRYAMTRH